MRNLGPLLARCQASAIIAYAIFGVGMVVLLAWLVLGSLLAHESWLHYGMGSLGAFARIVAGFLLVGIFFGPLGVVFAVKGWRGRVQLFDLFAGGVAFEDHKGRRELGWEEVVSVFWEEFLHEAHGFGIRRTAKLTVIGGGQRIVLDESLPDHVDVAARARDVAAEAMLPRFQAALAAGQRVAFGAIALDPWGMHTRRGSLAWQSIGCVQWESSGDSACYTIYDTSGAHLESFDTKSTPNEVILQVILASSGKLGTARELSAADRLRAVADRLVSRFRR